MMATIILILILLAFLHFIYESIILQSLRLSLRFKLFALRDELRSLRMAQAVTDEEYHFLQDSINNTIKILHRIDLGTTYHAHMALKNNDKLLRQVEQRVAFMERCANAEAKNIHAKRMRLFGFALLANNGALALYLLPFAVAIILLIALGTFTFEKLSPFGNIVYVPENQIEQVMSIDTFATI